MELGQLQPPSFGTGKNVIPGIPSRIVGGQLWILRECSAGIGLTAMGVAATAMPTLMGLAMADHRPTMLLAFGVAAATLLCVVMAHVRGWREYLVGDSMQRVVIAARLRRRSPLRVMRYELGWRCRVALVRRVQPVLPYYRHYRLKPGDTLEHPHGPARLNEVVYQVVVTGQGCQALQLHPPGQLQATQRVRGDEVPPLASLAGARPAELAQLRETAARLAAFLGLAFMDRSEDRTEFERSLSDGSPGIEHVALPIPGHNAPSWTTTQNEAEAGD